MKQILPIVFIIFLISCSSTKNKSTDSQTIIINSYPQNIYFDIYFEKGKSFNHPTFSIWAEDIQDNYITTIFVTQSVAKSKYAHGYIQENMWAADSGVSLRIAALPYWMHKVTKNNIASITPNKSIVPDGISGATPTTHFSIQSQIPQELPKKFKLLMEINQAWDWNNYWTNGKYPNSFEYKTSAQPSLIYSVTIDTESNTSEYYMNPIGHGHYAGEDGKLYTNLQGHTTALEIAKSIKIVIKK